MNDVEGIELSEQMNDAQLAAVHASANQPLLVIAGAGSGKTRVLIHRIAWLIKNNYATAQSILAVTFTNKAAQSIRSRLEALLGHSVQEMWIGTFHSIAYRILRQHTEAAGLGARFQILDSSSQLRLVQSIIELKLSGRDEDPKPVQAFINRQKDSGFRAKDLVFDKWNQRLQMLHMLYEAYEVRTHSENKIDFGELLLRNYELWKQSPEILSRYSERFDHILVDEFQDTSKIQYAWLRLLSRSSSIPITAVGDDDQSIYGWRGAQIENIQTFQAEFSPVPLIRLEQNYRSTQTILGAANAVISKNKSRVGKTLWTGLDAGEKIQLYLGYNDRDEARWIVKRIQEYLRECSLSRQEIAILYRSNVQSRSIEEVLKEAGIAYNVYRGQRFYEREEIRHALSYVRLYHNPHDDDAFERVFNVPTRGLGLKTQDKIKELALSNRYSLWSAAQDIGPFLPAGTAQKIQVFLNIIQTMQQVTPMNSLPEIVERVIEDSGLRAFYSVKDRDSKAQERIGNLDQLISAAGQFASNRNADVKEILEQFLDETVLGSHDANEKDKVQLMTLHAAKGLEFPLVFMTGMEEGLFPNTQSLYTEEQLEEERRLCYVGITRAMKRLVLTYAKFRFLRNREHGRTLSRFVKEIPESYIDSIDHLRVSQNQPKVRRQQKEDQRKGQKVFHKVFGAGVLLQTRDDGKSVQVQFADAGTKWLSLQHTTLRFDTV